MFFGFCESKAGVWLERLQKNKTLAARQQGLKLLCYHSTRGLHGSGMTVA